MKSEASPTPRRWDDACWRSKTNRACAICCTARGDIEISLERARQRRVARMPQLPVLPDPPPEEREVRPAKPAPAMIPEEHPGMSLEEMEKRHILATLDKNGGNRTVTAQELGISLRKLYYRLGQYQREGIDQPSTPENP